jgi:hypothetical protein
MSEQTIKIKTQIQIYRWRVLLESVSLVAVM